MSEHDEQTALFEWLAWQANIYPDLRWAYAVPNGQYRAGQRPEAGLKSGVPDVCIPVARGGYFGLYIELKISGNKPSANQREWLEGLESMGYATMVCNGFDEAVTAVETYIKMLPTRVKRGQ